METIFETYLRTICSNCKNGDSCTEELRRRLDNTVRCWEYIKDKEIEGYKEFKGRLANQEKPIMRI